jgi:predicted MFS family arabinose efflux permease
VVNLPAMTGVLSLEAVAGMAFGALDILAVVLAVDVFRGGDAATGYLTAAIGVGGVIGSLAAGVAVLQPRLRPPIVASVAVFAAALVLLGFAPSLAVAFLAIALVSGGNMVLDVMRTTIFQRVVPDAYRGRFGGLMMTTGVAAEALGVLVVPILAATLGLGFVLNLLAAGTLGATALGLVLIGAAANQDGRRPLATAGAESPSS